MSELIRVEDLRVVACGERGETEIVKGVSFALEKGEVLALIGECGSGKTTIALALLGYARRGCRLSGGVVQVGPDVEAGPQRGRTLRSRLHHAALAPADAQNQHLLEPPV